MNYVFDIADGVFTPHKNKYYEIIVLFNGDSILHYPNGNIFLSAGDIIIVPPNILHNLTIDKKCEGVYVGGEFKQIFNLKNPIVISDNERNEGVTLARILYKNRYKEPDYLTALFNAFTLFLLQNLKSKDNISIAVKKIVSEITDNFYDKNIDLCHIMKKSGYAEDYIRSQFKKAIGKTPTEFLTDIRIHHACFLIETYRNTLSMSQIAEKCGYSDYIYFSRRFKQIIGLSPIQYRDMK